jgi:hypothetical protein
VLQNCSTDFENPLSREWALLCIRNACSGNLANQLFIENLKFEKVVDDGGVLAATGVSIEMDTKTGKFSYKKTRRTVEEKPDEIRHDDDDKKSSLSIDDVNVFDGDESDDSNESS